MGKVQNQDVGRELGVPSAQPGDTLRAPPVFAASVPAEQFIHIPCLEKTQTPHNLSHQAVFDEMISDLLRDVLNILICCLLNETC